MKICKDNLWILIILICPFIFFFTPKKENFTNSELTCFKKVSFKERVLFIHNCDANSITSSSKNFSHYLLEWDDNPWKGRPLHILFGTVVSPVVYPFSIILKNVFFKKLNYDGIKKNYLSKLHIYISFYLFNIFLLILLSKLVFFILDTTNIIEKSLVSFLFSIGDMVNAWFWTGHSIFFGYIIPLFGIISFLIGYFSNKIYSRNFFLIAFFLGLGCLIYQMSVLWIGMFLLGLFFKDINLFKKKKNLYFVSLFLFPILFWFFLTNFLGISIFFEASKHSQFMWIFKIFDQSYRDIHGNFIYIFFSHLLVFFDNFTKSFGYQWIPPAFVIITCLAKNNNMIKKIFRNPLVIACVSIILLQSFFNFLQDENQPRFINPLITVLTLLSLWLVKNYNVKLFIFTLCFLVFSQIIFIFSIPPISLS